MTHAIFLALIVSCYVVSYEIMHQVARVSSRSYFLLRLVLLPGVILHEMAHVVGCIVTGTPIVNVSFWDAQGGHVMHHKPKLPFITQPIISLAPLPIGIGALLWLSHFVSFDSVWLSALALFLMLSIAGTLAPSKADLTTAAWGLIFLALLGAGIFGFIPQAREKTTPFLATANEHLLLVVGILGAFWIGLWITHKVFKRT